jgi:hypothetical protein
MSSTSSIPPGGNIGYAIVVNTSVISIGWMPFAQWQSGSPANAVILTEAQLQQMYFDQTTQYVLVNGQFFAVPAAPVLATVQTAACDKVDANAETCRQQFLTIGLGQLLVYQAKYAQAQAFLAAYPTDAQAAGVNANLWPLLQDEIDITGPDLWNVAAVLVATGTLWTIVSAMIEQVRLGAKVAIMAADSIVDVNGIAVATSFPTIGVPAAVAVSGAAFLSTGTPVTSPASN